MDILPYFKVVARYDPDSVVRLNNAMLRSSEGVSVDYRSPLYDGRSREEIVSLFKEIGLFGHPEMDQIDEEEIDKIGTYSIRLPFEKIRDSLFEYFQNDNPLGETQSFEIARGKILSLIPFRSLRRASLTSAFQKMPTDTNLGAPTWSRSREYAGSYLERATSIESYLDIEPFTLFWRGTANGTSIPKQRHVMGADHVDTILWETILIPLLDVLRDKSGFSAWKSPNDVDLAITELLTFAKRNGREVVSGDHSKFDTRLSRHIINVCFDFIESSFSAADAPIINILREEFLYTGVICPDGLITGKDGGVMSGTGGTNLIDSLGNYFASEYVAAVLKVNLERVEILGDDFVSVWSSPVSGELEDVMLEIGLATNSEKQFISDSSCHYLQRWHSMDYLVNGLARGVRSPFRALNGMMSYERLRDKWNKYMDSARWIMQANMVEWDKRFRSFVGILKKGDEIMSSGMDPVAIFKAAGGSAKIRQVLGIASFPFNVKRPEGVDAFSVTRVLRSL